jgi:hypothetical protein
MALTASWREHSGFSLPLICSLSVYVCATQCSSLSFEVSKSQLQLNQCLRSKMLSGTLSSSLSTGWLRIHITLQRLNNGVCLEVVLATHPGSRPLVRIVTCHSVQLGFWSSQITNPRCLGKVVTQTRYSFTVRWRACTCTAEQVYVFCGLRINQVSEISMYHDTINM